MKRKAFTLAEILITLGIIGVVAALTAPALVSESTDQIVSSRLASTVSDLENAFGNAMVSESVEELNETAMFKAATKKAFAGDIAKYYNIGSYVDKASNQFYAKGPYTIKGTAFANFGGDSTGNYFPIRLKNGAVAHFLYRQGDNGNQYNVDHSANETTIRNAGGSLVRVVAEIIIDVNGETKPNRAGRDMFKYVVGVNGAFYPVGGRDYALFLSNGANDNNMWSNKNANDLTKCISGNFGSGFGCTARVAEDGYKINY